MVRKQLTYLSPANPTPVIVPQISRSPKSWSDCFTQTRKLCGRTTASLIPPDRKSSAFNIMLTGHPSSKHNAPIVGQRDRIYSVGQKQAKRKNTGASTYWRDNSRWNNGPCTRMFLAGLKRKKLFQRAATLNILSAFEVMHNDILWFLARGRGLSSKTPFTYQEL